MDLDFRTWCQRQASGLTARRHSRCSTVDRVPDSLRQLEKRSQSSHDRERGVHIPVKIETIAVGFKQPGLY